MVAGFGVRVPASSANLGAGFDTLGLALALGLELWIGDAAPPEPGRWDGDEHHLAIRTFRAAGGEGPVVARADFAGGRGLGFSGAARVAGVFAACVQRGVTIGAARDEARDRASELEGHADNAAASALGGLVSVAGDVAVRVPIALDASVVLWIPDGETSTRTSRTQLPDHVPFADAVFNIGRAATLVAALASGDAPALRVATQDRMHQERRFDRVPSSRAALDAMIAAGAWGAWLSGSGPTVAGLCEPGDAPAIAAALPSGGRGIISAIDRAGVRLTTTERAAPC